MKKQLACIVCSATLFISINACNSDTTSTAPEANTSIKTTDAKEKTSTSSSTLISDAPPPSGLSFSPQDFGGIGTMQLPVGDDWTGEGTKYYNSTLDMSVLTFGQTETMMEVQGEYVQSYIDNNFRDAPNFKLNTREVGTINGFPAHRVTGTFNNGTEYTTRDYVFFTKENTGILQVRIAKTNEAGLKSISDYMASTFKKK